MRGFLTGIVSGSLVCGLGLSVASLLGPQPAGNTPPAAPQTNAPSGLSDPEAPTATTVAPQPAVTAPTAPAPEMEPTPSAPEAAASVDQEPATAPETGDAPIAPQTEAPSEAQPSIQSDAPVLPSPQTAGPDVPTGEDDLSISTDPAQPIAPSGDEDSYVVVEDTGPIPLAPETQETPTAEPSTDGTSRLEDAVPVRRVGGDTPTEATDAAADTAAPAPAIPALTAYREEVSLDGRPLLSVVMIDSDQFGLGPDTVSDLGMNVTFAVRASAPDAGARAQAYRAAGHEVLLLSDLPDGVTASDVAIALEASFVMIPEAVGMLDAGLGGLGSDREVIGAALSRLDEDGRGLVVLGGGLNAPLRAAEKADLPAAEILRDLDGQDQSAQIIRRFLDQAAFRARQDGAAMVLTRMRPETLSALSLWGAATRAQDVQMVPSSAIFSKAAD